MVAIGPLPMMRACAETTRPFGVKTMVSLNAIMVDGTGMCGSCRVTVGGETRFACVDGPDFDGHAVDFSELMTRQKRFKQEESTAGEDFAHVCNLELQLIQQHKHNYKKLKDVAPKQRKMPERDALARSRTFDEVNLGYRLEDALLEAERCIQCAVPTCVAGCPVSIDIPRFIRQLLVRDVDGALAAIRESNAFPSVCGRVCPQESQCEAQCIVGRKLEPVAIGRLERFVGDHAHAPRATPPPGAGRLGRVAICGSGPAGLSCAADLARYGADVTVFEALHVVGGVLQYGIPSFRLPREIISREVQGLRDMGVKLETDKVIGKTFTVPQLLQEKGFDAVFVGVGAGAPAFLGIPGENASQVYSANELLTRVNLMGGDRFPYLDTPIRLGKSVVVIGAGNTAMDCLRVSKRLGVPTVRCVYRRSEAEAPARVEELRHAREEGIEFYFLHGPVAILADAEGNVTGMKVERMELGEPDAKGRRRPVGTGEIIELECDTVVVGARHQGQPHRHPLHPGPRPQQVGQHRGRGRSARRHPGHQPARRLRRRRHRDRRRHRHPGHGRGQAGRALHRRLPGPGQEVAAHRRRRGRLRPAGPRGAAAPAGSTGPAGAGRARVRRSLTDRPGPSTESLSLSAPAPGAPRRTAAGERAMPDCPRCHRPLDDEESYICCAGAALSWRCDACGKASEGFAFPYGLCPACGERRLRLVDAREVDDQGALEAVRTAFEIELGGGAFYRSAAGGGPRPGRCASSSSASRPWRGSTWPPSPAATTWRLRPRRRASAWSAPPLYAGVEHRPEDPESLFRVAIGFEERAAAFFAKTGAAAPAASPERALYEELAAEEREHVALLRTELARYRAARPGLL